MLFHHTLILSLACLLGSVFALHEHTSKHIHTTHPALKGDGPYTIAEWDMGSFTTPPPELNMHLHFWVPIINSTNKLHHLHHNHISQGLGVVIFQSAFAGNIPVELYDTMFGRIVSNGYIAVGLDRLQGIDATREAADLHSVITYLNNNFNSIIRAQGLSTIANMNNLILASHSAAGHMITQYVSTYGCGNIKGMMMMDPVDGFDPWGIIPDFIITPGTPVNFTTPLLHIDNGYDPLALPGYPACSPQSMSNDRFYDAWTGPRWQINGTRYGHGDILDGDYAGVAGLMCDRDVTLTPQDLQDWRLACGDAIVSFLNAIINHQVDDLDHLEHHKYINVHTVLKNTYQGYSRQDIAGGFCYHEADSNSKYNKVQHHHKH